MPLEMLEAVLSGLKPEQARLLLRIDTLEQVNEDASAEKAQLASLDQQIAQVEDRLRRGER